MTMSKLMKCFDTSIFLHKRWLACCDVASKIRDEHLNWSNDKSKFRAKFSQISGRNVKINVACIKGIFYCRTALLTSFRPEEWAIKSSWGPNWFNDMVYWCNINTSLFAGLQRMGVIFVKYLSPTPLLESGHTCLVTPLACRHHQLVENINITNEV